MLARSCTDTLGISWLNLMCCNMNYSLSLEIQLSWLAIMAIAIATRAVPFMAQYSP